MTIGSGLSAQLGFGAESTWATAVTVDHFAPFDSESLAYAKGVLQGAGLRAGDAGLYGARRKVSTKGAAGTIGMDLTARGLGLLLKHGLGSSVSAPTLISGAAYKQVHALGSNQALGLTMQVGRPQTDGTVRPFTYNGCKINAIEISVSDGQLAKLSIDVVAQNEATATGLAAASYVTTNQETFSFAMATTGNFTLGGTVTTSGGEASVASGVNVATVVNSFMVRIARGMKTDRRGLGNAGLISEPIENDFYSVTGTLGGEFTSRTELYDLFTADTGTALHLALVGSAITGGGGNNTLDIVVPQIFFDTGAVNATGPDVIAQSLNFSALKDETNTQAQVKLISADSTL